MADPQVDSAPESGQPTPRRGRFIPARSSVVRWFPVAILAVCGLAWLLSWWSPVPVRAVTVVGASPDSVAAIRSAAGSLEGQALRDVDVDAIVARVAELPGIQGVDLAIQRPWTVVVVVDERHAFAQMKADNGYVVVDDAGETIRDSEKKVKRLPRLAGEPESRATSLTVLRELPESFTRRVSSVTSDADGRTELVLRSGIVVLLGDDRSLGRKAEVAESLLGFKPGSINVSVPERPAMTGDLKLPRKNREAEDPPAG